MPSKLPVCEAVLLLVLFASLANAQTPIGPRPMNSTSIQALAIYQANIYTSDEMPDSQITYNVTDPAVIDALFAGIAFSTELDCDLLEADDNTYMYVKFHDGTRKVFDFFFLDSHLALKDRRVPCYWVNDETRKLLATYKQLR